MHRRRGAIGPEEKSHLTLDGYNQCKVANLLFGFAANKRLCGKYGILSLAVHPGVIETEPLRCAAPEIILAIQEMKKSGAFYLRALKAGAATTLVAATDPGLGMQGTRLTDGQENYGAYLIDCQLVTKPAPGRYQVMKLKSYGKCQKFA